MKVRQNTKSKLVIGTRPVWVPSGLKATVLVSGAFWLFHFLSGRESHFDGIAFLVCISAIYLGLTLGMMDRDAFLFDRETNEVHYTRTKYGKAAQSRTADLHTVAHAEVEIDPGKPMDLRKHSIYRIKLVPKDLAKTELTSLYRYNKKPDATVDVINRWLDLTSGDA